MCPIDEDGYASSAETEQKQEHFRYILRVHLGIVKAILGKKWARYKVSPLYHYLDLTAGPGDCTNLQGHGNYSGPGSPLIFLDEVTKREMGYRAILFEKSDVSVGRLRTLCRDNGSVEVVHGTYQQRLPDYMTVNGGRLKYGLVYLDPSGNLPDLDALSIMGALAEWNTVDVLLYLAATTMKRVLNAFPDKHQKRFGDYLGVVRKKHWIIREPHTAFQWTFCIGTNWEAFPKFKRMGFYHIESPEGASILERLNKTERELRLSRVSDQPGLQAGAKPSDAAGSGPVRSLPFETAD